jgi:hypothetical protein
MEPTKGVDTPGVIQQFQPPTPSCLTFENSDLMVKI